jgi:hypothetical protein
MAKVSTIHFPAARPPGNVWGLWRVDGIFGTQGTYRNRSWGKFRVFVTNERNTVEVLLKGGARVLLSPDEPEEFVKDVLSTLSS